MPVRSIDDVVVLLEVFGVTDPPLWVCHHQIGGRIDDGQPTEEIVVCGGRVQARDPITCAVERVRDHQFSPVQISA